MSKLKHTSRITEYLITVWVIVTLNFFLPRMMPGDPFLFLSGDSGEEITRYSDEQIRHYTHYYGLDQSPVRQYGIYLLNLCRGNLGDSFHYNDSVSVILLRRLPWTLGIVSGAIIISTLIGTVLGTVSAMMRGRYADTVIYSVMMVFSEIPAFLIGLILLFLFAASAGWFPLSGAVTHYKSHSGFVSSLWDIVHHAIMPVTALSLARLSGVYLLARNSMITVLPKAYMCTARAKGLSAVRIVFRHALRNAMLPIVTRLFLSIGTLVGGAILVENVFAYPGLGFLMSEAVMVHDYPLIQGIFLLVTVTVLTANAASDYLYGWLDPRVAS